MLAPDGPQACPARLAAPFPGQKSWWFREMQRGRRRGKLPGWSRGPCVHKGAAVEARPGEGRCDALVTLAWLGCGVGEGLTWIQGPSGEACFPGWDYHFHRLGEGKHTPPNLQITPLPSKIPTPRT